MKNILIILFVIFSFSANAQLSQIFLDGKYYGENLYIQNPIKGYLDTCVRYIVVNEDTISDELNSNTIEVDLEFYEFEYGAKLSVVIAYDSHCLPVVFNREALLPPQKFKFSKPKVRKGKLQWRVYGELSDYPMEIQHLRWGKWRTINDVDPVDTISYNLYESEFLPHSGYNKIRLKTINLRGEIVMSKELRYNPPFIKEITIESVKVKEEIVFSQETQYEIYTEEGSLLKSGYERYVDVKDLEKGEYWLNFDNQSIKIKKK